VRRVGVPGRWRRVSLIDLHGADQHLPHRSCADCRRPWATPNGVSALLPTDYDKFFRVDAVTRSGRTVRLTRAGQTYFIDGHPLRVVGLADLGRKQSHYDACYTEDGDNYIDIILDGSEAAARRITAVEIPSTGRYAPLYNPGGPGNDPRSRRALQRTEPADLPARHHGPEQPDDGDLPAVRAAG
jgi:hypothetical protein